MRKVMILILSVDLIERKFSELFELDESLMPVMLIAIGKKEKDARPSTRMEAKDLVTFE